MTDKVKYVTIEANRLADLEQAERELIALEDYGVDNWPGYSEAMREVEVTDD